MVKGGKERVGHARHEFQYERRDTGGGATLGVTEDTNGGAGRRHSRGDMVRRCSRSVGRVRGRDHPL